MNGLLIKGKLLGEGAPLVCVPVRGASLERLAEETQKAVKADVDLIEFRADELTGEDPQLIVRALRQIRADIPGLPILFTYRTKREGGLVEVEPAWYRDLNLLVIASGLPDLIDVEWTTDQQIRTQLIEAAKNNGIYVVISNHDVLATPTVEQIVERLEQARDIGADVPKVSVTPHAMSDVLTLLTASVRYREKYGSPFIAISSERSGSISRVAGEVFGSALTFAAADAAAARAGQIPASELKTMLDFIHRYCV